MAKEFTGKQLDEIKGRFILFKENNPEYEIDENTCTALFADIIASSTCENGNHVKETERGMKMLVADGKVINAYNKFYKDLLNGSLFKMGRKYILADKNVEMDFDVYKKYENFMRGMFKDFVAPYVNWKMEEKDYRFGMMNQEDCNKMIGIFDRFNAEWYYKQTLTEMRNQNMTHLERIEAQMQVYPSNKTNVNKEELSSKAAVIYKCAMDDQNKRIPVLKYFNPFYWYDKFRLNNAKNYIQSLRDEEAKKDVPFDQYVRNCVSETNVSLTQFENVIKKVSELIDDTEKLVGEEKNKDLLNEKSNELDKELYGDSIDDNKIEMSFEEEANEVNNDFDIINTDCKQKEKEENNIIEEMEPEDNIVEKE